MTVAGTLPIDTDAVHTNERAPRRAAAIVGAVAAVLVLLVVLVGLWFLAPLIVGLAAAAVLAGPAFGARRLLDGLGARPVDEDDEPRYHNVLDGLCIAHGLRKPELYVVDDPARNAVATGRGPRQAALVVTTGLLEALTPIELEGVLAHEVLRIERRDTVVPVTASWFPPAKGWGAPPDTLAVDRAAVVLTRYPPGLTGALEKIAAGDATPARIGGTLAGSWLVPPAGVGDGVSLDDRVTALGEL